MSNYKRGLAGDKFLSSSAAMMAKWLENTEAHDIGSFNMAMAPFLAQSAVTSLARIAAALERLEDSQ